MTLEELEAHVKERAVVVAGQPDDVLSVAERSTNPEARFAMKIYVRVPGKDTAASSFFVSPVSREQTPDAIVEELKDKGFRALAMRIEKELEE